MLMPVASTAYGRRRQLVRRAPGPIVAIRYRYQRPPEHRITGNRLGAKMSTTLFHFSTLAVLAVFVVLLLGLWNMMRGTSPNTSQKLMRWRVGLQFVAILAIIAYFLLSR
jgi:hypothetical protein